MKLLGWPLILCSCHPNIKGRLRCRDTNLRAAKWRWSQRPNNAPTSQGARKIAASHQKPWERRDTVLLSQPQEEATLQTPWSWTPSLQNWKAIYFWCLGHPVCGILLRQPQATKTISRCHPWDVLTFNNQACHHRTDHWQTPAHSSSLASSAHSPDPLCIFWNFFSYIAKH